jgi:hypothetical protein
MAKSKVTVTKDDNDPFRAEPDPDGIENRKSGEEWEEDQNPPSQARAHTDPNTAKAKSVDDTHGTSLTHVHNVVNPAGFQEDIAALESTTGVAGTNMTETEAAEHVAAGTEDTLAEHEPPIDNPGGAETGFEAANAGETDADARAAEAREAEAVSKSRKK